MRASLLAVALAATTLMAADMQSPYAGEEQWQIKSLSDPEIRAYLQGDGMGLARAAELNHHPGPRHVLDLADELGLSAEQIAQSQRIHEEMKHRAMELGARLVTRERLLDRRFAERDITAGELRERLAEIAGLEGEIRYVHLVAHLEQRQVLTADQVRRYDELRGYGTGDHAHSH
jgi:hypothetical protein